MDFIESLFTLAETCQFGTLREELIRDRIVVGICNAVLSQKLKIIRSHSVRLSSKVFRAGKKTFPQDLPRRKSVNRHIKERNVQLLTPLAGNVRIVFIKLQNVKNKPFFQ